MNFSGFLYQSVCDRLKKYPVAARSRSEIMILFRGHCNSVKTKFDLLADYFIKKLHLFAGGEKNDGLLFQVVLDEAPKNLQLVLKLADHITLLQLFWSGHFIYAHV